MICSGNICRSPIAAGMLRERLVRRGVPARVRSAGFLTEGRPASEHGISLMQARGIDLGEHRSRLLTADDLATADLVLCMERAHVREIAVLDHQAFRRTFTLPELARRAAATDPRRPDESIGAWLGRVAGARRPDELVADRPDDEVPDPYGGSRREYRRTADRIEGLLHTVVDRLFPAEHPAPMDTP